MLLSLFFPTQMKKYIYIFFYEGPDFELLSMKRVKSSNSLQSLILDKKVVLESFTIVDFSTTIVRFKSISINSRPWRYLPCAYISLKVL
jgi:predicted rRNA methylase YqxC with S4 and FtsJ domains